MRFRKILAVVLMISILATISALAVSARFTYVNSTSATLTISGGTATVKGNVIKTSAATSCEVTCTLQKQNSSGGWDDVESWTKSSTSSIASVSETYSVDSGTYRVRNDYSATGSGGTESGTVYSNTASR